MIEAMKQALEALEKHYPYEDESGIIKLSLGRYMNGLQYLRQAIAELESQKPVAWIDFQKEAQQIVESKVLWKKFIDGTPLANDIACWMADFALQLTHPPQRKPLTDGDFLDWYDSAIWGNEDFKQCCQIAFEAGWQFAHGIKE